MTAVIKINVTDLNEQMIRGLQEKYGKAELEIHVRSETEKEILPEEAFWEIIDMLDWEKEGYDEVVIEPVVQHLSKLPVSYIYQFLDKLSEKLYLLDTQAHAMYSGENAYKADGFFSGDTFLYQRCCVVANGKAFYEEVLNDPSKMPQDLTFELLLSIAWEAYQRKTGEEMEYLPIYNYETFSNKEGWKDETQTEN